MPFHTNKKDTRLTALSLLAAGSDQDNYGRKPGRQLRRRYGSDLGSWRDPRLYVTISSPFPNLRSDARKLGWGPGEPNHHAWNQIRLTSGLGILRLSGTHSVGLD